MTWVDGCEDRPEEALRANAHGPSVLASYTRQRGIPFVFFSTDYVFDGTEEHRGPYTERDATRPLSVYGQSKLEGERAVLRVNPEAAVLRTSWVYGPDAAGKNFISTLQRMLRNGERMRVPADQISTPTLNRDLAQAALELAGAGASGVFHVTGPGLYSRYDLALEVATFFGLDASLIDGVPTGELRQKAVRPLYSGLVSERLATALPGFRMRSLHEGLQATAEAQAVVATV
ncbi:MAG: sugar nucleotide-binding protein [Rhodospirillales bacterium]|nr:sugar nucleotide-binding protein [Acetobacter sp.]